MEAAAREVTRLLAIAALGLAACGVKGPPRAPDTAQPPPEMAKARCTTCVVEEPQPGLVQEPAAPEPEAAPVVPEAVPPADAPENQAPAE